MKPMLEKLWKALDGKKLWTAVTIAIGYGVGVARAKYPHLPWDQLIIPILISLGLIGGAHKIVKRRRTRTETNLKVTPES